MTYGMAYDKAYPIKKGAIKQQFRRWIAKEECRKVSSRIFYIFVELTYEVRSGILQEDDALITWSAVATFFHHYSVGCSTRYPALAKWCPDKKYHGRALVAL
jgi:hypothetical protein